MNKAIMYISIWGLMVSATLLEIYIFTTSLAVEVKVVSIIFLAIAQALANSSYFQNLRYEQKMLSLLPLMAIIGLQTLLITANLSVGH